MNKFVARCANPNHFKGLGIVRMVGLGFASLIAMITCQGPNNVTISQCMVKNPNGLNFFRPLAAILSVVDNYLLPATKVITLCTVRVGGPPLPFIFPDVLYVSSPVFSVRSHV